MINMLWTSKTLPPNKNKDKNEHELTPEDYLTIKSGELIAKTEELNEANESLHLLNNEFKIKIQELKKIKKGFTECR